MSDKEYIIFCDESDVAGKYYSNFYGGVMVGSSQYDRVTARLNAEKRRLNFFGEVKWSKVTERYLAKYESLIRVFFHELRAKHVRVRIMFRQNAHVPVGLTQDQIQGAYFRLYYQFIKHAFGLQYRPHHRHPVVLKLYFDEFPETHEATTQFKGFILGLKEPAKTIFWLSPFPIAVLACEKRANRVPSRPVVTLPASPEISNSLPRAAFCLRMGEGDGDSHRANHSTVKKSYEHNKRPIE